MKKIIGFCILYLATVFAYAQTCPPVKQFMIERNGQYDVVPPPGWLLVRDDRNRHIANFEFLIAAWGDHKHPSDPVRCHYYDFRNMQNHIQLETQALIEESKITSHPNWVIPGDHLYHLCRSDSHDINFCAFN